MSQQQQHPSPPQGLSTALARDAKGRAMRQTIAIVSAGLVTLPDGTTFQLDSEQGREWLLSIMSFRFVSALGYKPLTARRQLQNALWYWYGYRKVGKSPRKKYIGIALPEVIIIARLEEVAKKLTYLEPYQS